MGLLEKAGDRFELGKSLRSLGHCLKLAGSEVKGDSYLASAIQTFQDLGAQGELRKTAGGETDKSFTDSLFRQFTNPPIY